MAKPTPPSSSDLSPVPTIFSLPRRSRSTSFTEHDSSTLGCEKREARRVLPPTPQTELDDLSSLSSYASSSSSIPESSDVPPPPPARRRASASTFFSGTAPSSRPPPYPYHRTTVQRLQISLRNVLSLFLPEIDSPDDMSLPQMLYTHARDLRRRVGSLDTRERRAEYARVYQGDPRVCARTMALMISETRMAELYKQAAGLQHRSRLGQIDPATMRLLSAEFYSEASNLLQRREYIISRMLLDAYDAFEDYSGEWIGAGAGAGEEARERESYIHNVKFVIAYLYKLAVMDCVEKENPEAYWVFGRCPEGRGNEVLVETARVLLAMLCYHEEYLEKRARAWGTDRHAKLTEDFERLLEDFFDVVENVSQDADVDMMNWNTNINSKKEEVQKMEEVRAPAPSRKRKRDDNHDTAHNDKDERDELEREDEERHQKRNRMAEETLSAARQLWDTTRLTNYHSSIRTRVCAWLDDVSRHYPPHHTTSSATTTHDRDHHLQSPLPLEVS